MILQQLRDVTSSHGLVAVPTAGQPFDPERHEALMRVETDDLGEGMIVGELRKGYILNGRIVRAAQVKVAAARKHE
jgi:molecular chaperone GrpE